MNMSDKEMEEIIKEITKEQAAEEQAAEEQAEKKKKEEQRKQAHREAQKRYNEKTEYSKSDKSKNITKEWKKKNIKSFSFSFNVNSDKDVLKRIKESGNAGMYIKSLILDDIEREG